MNVALVDARIAPPTYRNLPAIGDDLLQGIQAGLNHDDHRPRRRSEQTIRDQISSLSCAARLTDPEEVHS